jgi:tetratricopeptide (TPR) repeat protein
MKRQCMGAWVQRCRGAWVSRCLSAVLLLVLLATSNEQRATVFAQTGAQSSELNNRGVKQAQAGQFEKGVSFLRQALTLAPNDANTRKNLSGVLTDWAGRFYMQGKAGRAVPILEEAVVLDPENGKGLVLLGNLYYMVSGDLEGAVTMWRQAHGKIPTAEWKWVSRMLTQAERDLKIERSFTGGRTDHFLIRFEGLQRCWRRNMPV